MNEVGVNFDFNELKILSGTDDVVRLICMPDNSNREGVLHVPKPMFREIVNAWINRPDIYHIGIWVTALEIEAGDEIDDLWDEVELVYKVRRVRGFLAEEFMLLPPEDDECE